MVSTLVSRPPPSHPSPVLLQHLRRHGQQRQQRRRRRPQQQQPPWCVVGFVTGILGMSALLSSGCTPVFATAAAAAASPPRGAVDDEDSPAASLLRRQHHRHSRRRIAATRRHTENDHARAQSVVDDDDDAPSKTADGDGAIVCESVIVIASTRLFHSNDDDLAQEEDNENNDGDASTDTSSFSRGFGVDDDTRRRSKKKSIQTETTTGHEEFVCELSTGDTVPIAATPQQVGEMREALADGSLVSAVSTIAVQEVTVATTTTTTTTTIASEVLQGQEAAASESSTEGASEEVQEVVDVAAMEEGTAQDFIQEVIASSMDGGDGSRFIQSVSLPPGSIQLKTEGTARRRRQVQERRELASYTGTKLVLAVRVTDVNGLAPPGDAHFMSDKLFGTHGDTETMVSQFASCSYGAFRIVTQYYPQLSAPGVLDVQIPISLRDSTRDAIRKAVQSAVAAKLGFSASPGPFAHVLYAIEKCYVDCGWAAYAFVNSWLSVYQSNNIMYPAVNLHEIGHNLNLGHSGGLDGKTYSDHSCLMGNPLFSDDIADMCYNPAKTHQLIMSNGKNGNTGNWYDASRVSTWNPGSTGSMWSGKLVGVAEYGQITNDGGGDRRLVLRIVSGGSTDLYVGFNRKTGINEDNKQGSDMVTVIQAAAGGINYSTSSLKATLKQGQSFYIPNWRGDGSSLEVFADVIRTDVVPGYAVARVVIAGGNGPANPPTNPPTRVPPTRRPTRIPIPRPLPTLEPSQSPVTDYPSPSPVTDRPSLSPTFPPTPNPTPDPSVSPTYPPSPSSPDKEISAGLDTPGRRVRGVMFTVTAKDHDVIVAGMDVTSRRNLQSDITIYTKPGTFHNEENNSPIEADLHVEEWQEIYRGSIPSQPQKLVSLDDFTVGVAIAAGLTQSFFVYVSNGLLYTAAAGESTAAQNDDIIIHEGQVMRGLFQKVIGLGRWGGVMRYRMA